MFVFRINICLFRISDEYESFENMKCESITHDNGLTTLAESKAECSLRSDCFGVVTNGFSYKFCTFPNSIIHQDGEDDSAILEPIVFHTKSYHSGKLRNLEYKSKRTMINFFI